MPQSVYLQYQQYYQQQQAALVQAATHAYGGSGQRQYQQHFVSPYYTQAYQERLRYQEALQARQYYYQRQQQLRQQQLAEQSQQQQQQQQQPQQLPQRERYTASRGNLHRCVIRSLNPCMFATLTKDGV
eukprot:TRINITY_DN91714_c0_g1_i1.p2 TRINITY_DN91714_c0_g1~~TRINITY_DN91714_c0_g1_i1.p2  ORF type:complete len:145 (-),score=5.01 TRINITY_DN91714_c0_g1_i1:11-397(-)